MVDLGWRTYRYTKQDMYGNRASDRRSWSEPVRMDVSGVRRRSNPH